MDPLASRIANAFSNRMSVRIASRFITKVAFGRVLVAFGVNDLEKLSQMGRSFGVISAYRAELSKSENQKRHGDLMRDLQKSGYKGMQTFKSQWEDMATGEVHHEKSVFIPHADFKELNELGKKYKQDAVLYKDHSGSIGVYFKDGTATMAFDPKGDMAVTKSKGKDDYSRGRSMSFGLSLVEGHKFKYDDNPITREEVVHYVKNKDEETAEASPEKSVQQEDKEEKAKDTKPEPPPMSNFLEEVGDQMVPNPNFDHTHAESVINPRRRKIRNLPSEHQSRYYEQWARKDSASP